MAFLTAQDEVALETLAAQIAAFVVFGDGRFPRWIQGSA